MRKLVRTLTIAVCSIAIFAGSSDATTVKKPKATSYEALKQRVIEDWKSDKVEFQKDSPNMDAELRFISSKYREKYRIAIQKQLEDGERLFQTRSVPVEIIRVISIKRVSKNVAKVDYCYVSSLTPSRNPVPLDSPDIPLVGSRDIQEWIVESGRWMKGAQQIGPLLRDESECLKAE